MKVQLNFFNNREKEAVARRRHLNHKQTLRDIEDTALIAKFGDFSDLLPDHLMIYAKDKSYSRGQQLHELDEGLVERQRRDYAEGKAFRKRVSDYVYEETLKVFKQSNTKEVSEGEDEED